MTRFTTKKDGRDFIVKDNVTGKTIAIFPHDSELPEMAEKYAKAAAKEFNRLAAEKIQVKRSYGQNIMCQIMCQTCAKMYV